MVAHAPPKLLAKQWLLAYQFAPVFVAPVILLGALSNAILAYSTASSPSPAVATASVIPYTALYMESGQGTDKDTTKAKAKAWAEGVDMKTIANAWAKTNAWRYVITGIVTVISATATAFNKA
ncbi:uncharacterized protein K460DRAFT_374047 [Cucurbitaria berberidis CBS 394.84]|uniref:DUF1772-domain-containing protein n=1 Tax=Cucurbitaria berberidis CBS 394.84 TaxID=1168544 RepID=A0A9P4GVB0_9PLEO|nr:uncharacterized protein K460DRAFT_374047 [Cucurbitaria berberidis CBS 394.84]KAF1852226.1 hypothetical protein K460DRAFT_374047 [Cucurbitaria berberidis CBS 394.84]